ncbi:MAG: hypothetical protein ACOCWL_00280, partial [Thermoguttaceae bacterium]
YEYVANRPLITVDPSGESLTHVAIKSAGRKLPFAMGFSLDVTAAAIVGWKQGADVMFFPDTCEVASYKVVQKAFPAKIAGWEPIDGGLGLGAGVSVTFEFAFHVGEGAASAKSFEGPFYTVSGGIGPLAPGLYTGGPPPSWLIGGNIGLGVGVPLVTGYYANMQYAIGLGPKVLPDWFCYCLIAAM